MIEKIKEKPFLLLLFFACVFLFCGFIPTTKTIDIQLHDSYWVFGENNIFFAGCFLFYLLFGFYLLVHKVLFSKRLIWMHVLTTIVFTLFFFFISKMIGNSSTKLPNRYNSFNEIEAFQNYSFVNNSVSIVTVIIFLSQFLFLINIIVGIIKKLRLS